MEFLAYNSCGESVRISYEDRDESAGVLGTVATSQPPIGESETRAGITEVAYAFLGRDPTGLIYVTDSENRLLEIVLNEKYHKDIEAQASWHFMAWALLFLCVVCFLGTLAVELNWRGFGLFFVIAAIYIASVRLGIQNEVESAVQCTIVLLLILVLVPAIRVARGLDSQRSRGAEQTDARETSTQSVLNGVSTRRSP